MPRKTTRTTKTARTTTKTVSSPATLGDLSKRLSNIKVGQILYGLLLVAFLLIGYLIARVQTLEKGATSAPAAAAGQQAQQPQQPSVPAQKDVLKKLTNGHFPAKGNPNAKVKFVEFADFRCPFCEKYFTDAEQKLIKDYVDTGKMVYYFRQYAFLGPASTVAANAAECANEQGKFWDFHEYLYRNQPPETDTTLYTTDKMTEIAGTLGLDTGKFQSCLSSNKFDKKVSQDFNEGQSVGVNGTPTFYINGRQLVGAQPYEAFKAIIDEELKK